MGVVIRTLIDIGQQPSYISLSYIFPALAEVAELVDALASGASGGNPVEVQVLSSAPMTTLSLIILLQERLFYAALL